jgi:hypothetical protein
MKQLSRGFWQIKYFGIFNKSQHVQIIYIFIILLQMGFSPVAVVRQVHNRQVTHITRVTTHSIKHNTQNTTLMDTLPQ